MARLCDFIVITDDFWRSTPRVRHKMPVAWASAGHRVLWCERSPFPAEWGDGRLTRSLRGPLEGVAERLWVLPTPPALPRLERSRFPGPLLRQLHGSWLAARVRRAVNRLGFRDPVLVLMQHGARADLLGLIPHEASVYYTHDLFGYGTLDEQDRAQEDGLCRLVDWVWTTSEPRAAALAPHARRIRCLPHAVDLAWWRAHVADALAPVVASIPSPRLVFTGAVDFRIDWPLVRALAAAEPRWQWVFCGPVTHDSRAEVANLPPNVHAIGSLPLNALPPVIQAADALLLPYRIEAMTENIGRPLKYYDYLASGRPIVSSRFADFGPGSERLVRFASGVDEWLGALRSALAERDELLAAERRREAELNGYEARMAEQFTMLDSLEAQR